jgi:hypothetical protein
MSNVPPEAQLSDDGNYWWDGSQWQPVQPQDPAQPEQQTEGPVNADDSDGVEIDIDFSSQYPHLWAVASASSYDDWLSSLGIDVAALNGDVT